MKLSISSWHYKFWMLNYSRGKYYTPGQNFCDYFWSLVFATLFIPFTWVGLIIKAVSKNNNRFIENLFLTFLSYLAIAIVGALTVGAIKNTKEFFIILGTVVGVVVIAIGLFYLLFNVYPNSKFKTNVKEIKTIAKEGFYSFKNSYCPKISWNK